MPSYRLYARFSPRPGAEECDSSEKQLVALREWCAARGYVVSSEHRDDGLSGADQERPGLFDAIQACQKGDTLLVRDWDRFSRDRTFAGIVIDGLKKKGVEVRSISENGDMPSSLEMRLINNILLDIAEYKRGTIAGRTRSAMRAHQKAGRIMSSRIPFGYQEGPEKDGHRMLEVCHLEQASLRRMRKLRESGLSYPAIAREMAAVETCRGGRWHVGTIHRILNREEGRLPCV